MYITKLHYYYISYGNQLCPSIKAVEYTPEASFLFILLARCRKSKSVSRTRGAGGGGGDRSCRVRHMNESEI